MGAWVHPVGMSAPESGDGVGTGPNGGGVTAPAAPDATQAVLSGQVDIYQGGTATIHANVAGSDLIYVAASVDRSTLVLFGQKGLMTLDGEEFEVGPGDVVLNRPGGTHGLRNIAGEELRIVVIEVESPPDEHP